MFPPKIKHYLKNILKYSTQVNLLHYCPPLVANVVMDQIREPTTQLLTPTQMTNILYL